MLTDPEAVQAVPGLGNTAAVPIAYLNDCVRAADAAVKRYLKQNVELAAYQEYVSGDVQQDVVLKQWPVRAANTAASPSAAGSTLPSEFLVLDPSSLDPGGRLDAVKPAVAVQTAAGWTWVTYSRVDATGVLRGVSGGSGTLTASSRVCSPSVWYDPNGWYGSAPNSFGDSAMLVLGQHFAPVVDAAGRSRRGLLRRIGGGMGAGFVGFSPDTWGRGKLAAFRKPAWPRGEGNILVRYSAGYAPGEVPHEIRNAATRVAIELIRTTPAGGYLAGESLGGYSYSVLTGSADPEIASLRRLLAPHREVSL